MSKLLNKELKLTASPLSYLFILFGVMALIPQYPILLAGFFICFGIFHTFQAGREAGDVIYTAMLPVRKSDVVRARFAFCVFIQMAGFALTAILTVVRICFMSGSPAYANNTLMNANLAYLGYLLMIYAAFNLVFVRTFFKTAYNIGVPFFVFCGISMLIIAVCEAIHFFPGMQLLNDTTPNTAQLIVLVIGIVIYVGITLLSLYASIRSFEKIDL